MADPLFYVPSFTPGRRPSSKLLKSIIAAAFCCMCLAEGVTRGQEPKRDLTDTTWEQTGYATENPFKGDPTMEQFGVPTKGVLKIAEGEPDKPTRSTWQLFRVENDELIRELAFNGTYDGANIVISFATNKAQHGYDGTDTLKLTLIEEKDKPAQLKGTFESRSVTGEVIYKPRDIVLVEVSERLPVIFLPGVAGSILTVDQLEVWPFAPAGTRAGLALREDGLTSVTGRDVGVGDVLRRLGTNFYGEFIESLVTRGYKPGTDLFTFPYDWRYSNDVHYARLEQLVKDALEKSKQKKVILIAHSMGGVISRGYIYSSAQRAEKVSTVITIGTPFWGAPKVYYAVTSGYQFGNPSVRQELMKILLQNCPSAYQLLPQRDFINDKKSGQPMSLAEANTIKYKWFDRVLWGVEDQYYETTGNDKGFNDGLLNKASDFYASVGKPGAPRALPGNVKLYTIIGTGVSTLGYYDLEDWTAGILPIWPFTGSFLQLGNGRKVILHPVITDGDGTVPMWSLETPAMTARYYVPHTRSASAGHSELPDNKVVQEIVAGILNNKPPDPAKHRPPPTWNGIPLAKLQPLEDNTSFELHSDAHLRITGGSGKALGLDDNGVLDESLAGTFLAYEGIEFAAISDLKEPLDVSINGIRTGKFTLHVKIRKGGKDVSEFAYNEVPVLKGTKTRFTFTPASLAEPPVLTVRNGDITSTVAPVVILAAKSGSSGDTGSEGGTLLADIPLIGGTVTSFRFFTADAETLPPPDLRDYLTSFSQATLKTVYYEFNVKYASDSAASFKMSSTWKLNGRPFARQDLTVAKPRDWTTSTKMYGHGYREPGKWEPGIYTVDIDVEGRRVASASFVVK